MYLQASTSIYMGLFTVGERMVNGYAVLVVPIVLKKVGIVKGEGRHRKYTEETFVEELRNARFQSVQPPSVSVREPAELALR